MNSGPQNAIVGDSFGIDLPETQVDQTGLIAEKNAAKFSRTKEFKVLKEHFQTRIKFYETYLPSGVPAPNFEGTMSELGQRWMVATSIITELNNIIRFYEDAQEIVQNAARR